MKTDLPADTRMMGIVHSALKRDLLRAREVLASDPPPRGRQRVALGEHVSWMLEFLHGHHSGEDAGLWPLVRERNPDSAALLDSMEEDHARIAPAADAAAATAAEYAATATDGPRAALVGALDDLLAVLVPHLDREVAEAMPGNRPDPQESAARRVERWALVGGVTGCTANGLLLALYAVGLPGDESYRWTGPANDVVGAVAALSMIPMTAGVRDLLGSPGPLPLLTKAVAVGGTASAASSALLLTGVIGLPAQAVVGTGFGAVLLLWTAAVGHPVGTSGVLPRRLSRAARIIGGTGLAGMALAAAGAALPRGSRAQYAVGGAGVALGSAGFLALPVWQVLLSRAMSGRVFPLRPTLPRPAGS